jgi:hypothetical protein
MKREEEKTGRDGHRSSGCSGGILLIVDLRSPGNADVPRHSAVVMWYPTYRPLGRRRERQNFHYRDQRARDENFAPGTT